MTHGGNLRELASEAQCSGEEILDFSASLNPLGPPGAVSTLLTRAADDILAYPDPASTELREAIAKSHAVSAEQVVAGNGSSELFSAIGHAFPQRRWVLMQPCYGGYEHAARSARREVTHLPRTSNDFGIDWVALEAHCDDQALVVIAHPNNPTGNAVADDQLRALINRRPQTLFVLDESFAPFISQESLGVQLQADNVIVVRSMTKFFAIAGLRLGYAVASEAIAATLFQALPEWNVNRLAQQVGTHCISDHEYSTRTRKLISQWRSELTTALTAIAPLNVFRSTANFLLCKVDSTAPSASSLADALLQKDRIAIRKCQSFQQLDDRYFRVAVRSPEENQRLTEALTRQLTPKAVQTPARVSPRRRQTPALMIQGVSSNAGKSILATAFCRIFARAGIRVAPFKSQNMSLNSFVTAEGHEISRAQVVQAQAANLEPDVRMNPILLKPNSHTGSQVIVHGKPVGNMRVREYYQYKPTAFEHAKHAYDELADEFDLMVLEGAGSPGEVNLKQYDIVNMNMARHAKASVLLVGDIDRGGVFASFVGTMAVLEAWERRLVSGYVINRFRGDPSLLEDAYTYMRKNTGKPVLGTVPNISNLAIPDEDSVTFKREVASNSRASAAIDIVVIDLPHISNLSDFDPLKAEPDVSVRTVRDAQELGSPDVIILPGSRNTIGDLQDLRSRGFERLLHQAAADPSTEIIGICAGLQMLGRRIRDPQRVESNTEQEVTGLELLDVVTELASHKTLRQVETIHAPSAQLVTGYEIHHGSSVMGEVDIMLTSHEEPLAIHSKSGNIWATYLHGIFEQDGFRRHLLDQIRQRKNLSPLGDQGTLYNLDAAYDALADVVAANIDMNQIEELLGL